MTIEAVVFDVGNVLINWAPEQFYDARIGEPARRALFAETEVLEMNLRVDRGEGFRDVIYATADKYPAHRDAIRMWHDHWIDIIGDPIADTVETLHALKAKGLPVYGLTNFGAETYELARPVYPFLEAFDQVFVSGRLKTIKPEPEIYAILEEAVAQDPMTLLFVDDSVPNLEGALARGWQVHHFTSPEGWRKRLRAEGLLP